MFCFLQCGEKLDVGPFFAYQYMTRGRAFVLRYSSNVVYAEPPTPEEYQMQQL